MYTLNNFPSMFFSKMLNDCLLISKSVVTVFPQCVCMYKTIPMQNTLSINLLNINIQYRFPVDTYIQRTVIDIILCSDMKMQKNVKCVTSFHWHKTYLHHKEEILMVSIVYMNFLSEQGVKAIKSPQFSKVIQKILSLKMSASVVYL